MSSKRFNQLVASAYRNNDLSAMRDAYYDYQATHCLYPTRQLIFDAHLGTTRFIDVACGKCYHCQQSKINEWCTRMYAHVEDFKHVYFVTLTYRSITNPDLPINRLFLNKLVQAVWNNDPFNATHHMSYNPCLLVKSHYQNFLKRLRKYTGFSDLTYVLSGEYGKEFGRPHFHLLLFTNNELTRQDILRAWSIAIWRNNDGTFAYRKNQKKNGAAYDMPIGRVDFHDLVSNGTFNTAVKIKVDGSFLNARNCFSYVCKYVVKRDDANLCRVKLAYNNLFHKYQIANTTGKSLHDILFYNRCAQFTPEQIYKLTQLKLNPYEKIIYQPCKSIYKHGLRRTRPVQTFGINNFYCEVLLPEIYQDFSNSFKPFCEFSRGTPIGSVYASRHLPEFAQGVFNKPLLQSDGFVVPNYFRIKAREHLYGLRKMRQTIKSCSFNLGNLPDLYRRFSESSATGLPLSEYIGDTTNSQIINTCLHDPNRFFLDKSTGERVIFYNNYAQFYKYSRKKHGYSFTRAVPLAAWIRDSISRLENEFNDYYARLRVSKENMRLSESAKLMLLDYGYDHTTLRQRYLDRVDSIKKQKQLDYNQFHLFAE